VRDAEGVTLGIPAMRMKLSDLLVQVRLAAPFMTL
jgi:hypothetical protein